jgi:hypothetical protein
LAAVSAGAEATGVRVLLKILLASMNPLGRSGLYLLWVGGRPNDRLRASGIEALGEGVA